MKFITKFGIIILFILQYLNTMAQQNQVSRKDLLNAPVNQQVSLADMKEVTLPAGQVVPKHLHPCPVVGYIISGNVFFQVEGEEGRILKAGDAFYEPRNKVILHFDNAQKDQPLTFFACYLKEGSEENIKILTE